MTEGARTRRGSYEELKDAQLQKKTVVTLKCTYFFMDTYEIQVKLEEINEIIYPDRITVPRVHPAVGTIYLRYTANEEAEDLRVKTIKDILDRYMELDIKEVLIVHGQDFFLTDIFEGWIDWPFKVRDIPGYVKYPVLGLAGYGLLRMWRG